MDKRFLPVRDDGENILWFSYEGRKFADAYLTQADQRKELARRAAIKSACKFLESANNLIYNKIGVVSASSSSKTLVSHGAGGFQLAPYLWDRGVGD